MPRRKAKQIYNKIKNAEHVLIVPHKNPDGDAIGSAAALMHFLKNQNIDHTVFCDTGVEKKLNFLPYVNELKTDKAVWNEGSYDLVIVVDSGDLEYAGIDKYISQLNNKPPLINIDHHPTNTNFGDLNLVVPSASSTTQILYHFFMVNDVSIDSHLATCLLTGIITDTDNFSNAGTTVASLEIASDLVKKGGDINMIKQIFFQDKTINTLKLWGTVLSRLSKHDEHEIVYTYLTQKDMEEYNVDEKETKGIANFMNVLKDGKAALILKEKSDGKVKGSFRTTRDDIDVSKIAKSLGGGGHKKAAGFSMDEDLKKTIDKVWSTLDKIKKQR